MRFIRTFLCVSLTLLSSHVLANDPDSAGAPEVKYNYQVGSLIVNCGQYFKCIQHEE